MKNDTSRTYTRNVSGFWGLLFRILGHQTRQGLNLLGLAADGQIARHAVDGLLLEAQVGKGGIHLERQPAARMAIWSALPSHGGRCSR